MPGAGFEVGAGGGQAERRGVVPGGRGAGGHEVHAAAAGGQVPEFLRGGRQDVRRETPE